MNKTLKDLRNELEKKGFSNVEAKAFIFDVLTWWQGEN